MQAHGRTYWRGWRAAVGDWLAALGSAGALTATVALLQDWANPPFLPNLFYEDNGDLVYLVIWMLLTATRLSSSRRLGAVATGPDGLALLTVNGLGDRLIPWSEIHGTERAWGMLILHTAGGTIRLTSSLIGRDELLAEIAQRQTAAPVPLSRATRTPCAWLLDAVLQGAPPLLIIGLVMNLDRLWWGLRRLEAEGATWLQVPWSGCTVVPPDDAGVTTSCVVLLAAIQAALFLNAVRRWRVRCLEVTPAGLRIERLAGRPLELAWPMVRGAVLSRAGLRLWTAEDEMLINSSLRAARELPAKIAAGCRSILIAERIADREVYPRSLTSGLLDGLGPLAALFLCQLLLAAQFAGGLPLSRDTAIGLSLLIMALWAGVVRRGRVRGVVLSPDSLRVDRLSGEPFEVPWPAVKRLERRADGWRLKTTHGLLAWSSSLQRPRELEEAVRKAIERHRPIEPEEPPVAGDEIAGWLGIGPDEVLRVRALRLTPLIVGGLVWLALLAGLACGIAQDRFDWELLGSTSSVEAYYGGVIVVFVVAFWLLYYPAILGLSLRADALRRVEACAHGLRWREGRAWSEAGWDEVRSAKLVPRACRKALLYLSEVQMQADQEVLVDCGGQHLRFHPRDHQAGRLRTALDRLLAERRAGRRLPAMTDVPATSISRAEPASASAERGLSRV